MTSFLALASFTASHLQHFSCIALGNSVAGRAAEKKKEHRHAAVAYLEIASSHAGLISTFRFSMLVYFSLHIWITPPFSAMDVAIQRQLNQCTLEELIQIAIHLIFEIQCRLALLEQSEYGTSDCGISDSDDEL